MTATIRGKSGKDLLRSMLNEHDDCTNMIEVVTEAYEPFSITDVNDSFHLHISKTEFLTILAGRMRVIETKLENLGLRIGEDVQEDQARQNDKEAV